MTVLPGDPPAVLPCPPAGVPEPHRAAEFRACPGAAGRLRAALTARLEDWRLPQLAGPAAAGAGRLLADVARHSGSEQLCTVELVLLWDRLAVSVRHEGPRPHHVPALAGARDSGGVRAHQDRHGRTLWFTLPVPYPPTPPEAHAVRRPWAAHA